MTRNPAFFPAFPVFCSRITLSAYSLPPTSYFHYFLSRFCFYSLLPTAYFNYFLSCFSRITSFPAFPALLLVADSKLCCFRVSRLTSFPAFLALTHCRVTMHDKNPGVMQQNCCEQKCCIWIEYSLVPQKSL
jgi:hypothetical protein